MSTDEKLLKVLEELLTAVKALSKEVQGVGITSNSVASELRRLTSENSTALKGVAERLSARK